jgi:hypothetical protein
MLYEVSTAGKLVQFLKDVAPQVVRVALLASPENLTATTGFWKSIQEVSKTLGLNPTFFPVRSAAEIEAAITDFARESNGGIVLPHGRDHDYASRRDYCIDRATPAADDLFISC